MARCKEMSVFAAFTPANFTSRWSLIDDYVGTDLRRCMYEFAEQFEADYFEKNPKGDGGVEAGQRRVLCAQWFDRVFEEAKTDERRKELRVNAAKRVGLFATVHKPADSSYLPCPVRFHENVYRDFGEVLYDKSHVDHNKVQAYLLAGTNGQKPDPAVRAPVDVDDKDGHSQEGVCVWNEEEADWDSDSAEAPSDEDVGVEAEEKRVARSRENKERRRANGIEDGGRVRCARSC
jgi:hypothetical protein